MSVHVPRWLREGVIERADCRCDWCGKYLPGQQYSLQHRRARGAGGRANAHSWANLVVLCGSATTGCHGRVENTGPGRREGYALGFAIRGEVQRPEDVPIFRHCSEWVIPGEGLWVPSSPIEDEEVA